VQAQHYYDLFLLLTEVGGITLSEIAGGVFKEDLAYLLAQQRFKIEASNKWSSDASSVRVKR
jgi:hypothetical protein